MFLVGTAFAAVLGTASVLGLGTGIGLYFWNR